MSSPQSPNKDSLDRFVCLLSESQRPLLAFIQTLVCGWANAEEVLQEANTTIWKKRESFDLDTNFMHWTKKIAYYKVLEFRRESRGNRFLSDEAIESLASDMINKKKKAVANGPKSEALEDCVKKLSKKDLGLLRQRYFDDIGVQDISKATGRPSRAIYASLQRIRNSLRTCILRSLATGEQES